MLLFPKKKKRRKKRKKEIFVCSQCNGHMLENVLLILVVLSQVVCSFPRIEKKIKSDEIRQKKFNAVIRIVGYDRVRFD